MEDNLHNELIENGTIHTFLRSGSNRIISQPENTTLWTVSSKSKLRQRNVKEQHTFTTQSHETTTYTTANSEKTKAFYDDSNFDVASEFHTENGLSTSKNIEILASGNISNSLTKHKHVNENPDISTSKQRSTRRSAYLFYKAAGDWWNKFPKTDYTYSKSSSYRKEIAPGVMTMPNMSRSPIRSSLDMKSMDTSSLRFNRSYNVSQSDDCTDDVFRVSSTTLTTTTTLTSVLIRIFTTIWHMVSSVSNVLTLKKFHLGFESIPAGNRSGYVAEKTSRYHRLEVMLYQSACSFLLLDSWILSLFHSSRHHSHHLAEKKRHSKYLLLLLLIPPFIWLGLWYNSMGTSALAVLSSCLTTVKNLIPSLLVQKISTSDLVKHADLTLEDGNMELLVQKILSSSEFKNIIYMHDFRNKEQQIQSERAFKAVVELEQERLKAKLEEESLLLAEQKIILMEQQLANEHLTLENSAMKDQIEKLEMQMKLLQAQRLHLSRRIADCHKRIIQTVPRIEVEQHVTNFLSGLFDLNGENEDNNPENMKVWIRTLLTAKDDLEKRLADTVAGVNERMEEAAGKSAETIMASVSDMMREEFLKQDMKFRATGGKYVQVTGETVSRDPCDPCLSTARVKEIVNNALNLYDADKTGMVDYALESAGGTVINIRCTEIYNDKSLSLSFLGMTLPWSSNHPRIALQPDVHPGKCFAFRGAQGYLVIRLSSRIKVSAFSIEHIPVSLSPTGNINAAPKNFSVLGLNNENDRDPVLLGKYMYETTGPPLQIFPVQTADAPPYQIVELHVESNHGNVDYTCLYRFRVHGVVV